MEQQPINILLVTRSKEVSEAVAGGLGRCSARGGLFPEATLRVASTPDRTGVMVEDERPDVILIDVTPGEEPELERLSAALRDRYQIPLVLILPDFYSDVPLLLQRIRPFDFLPRAGIAEQLERLLRFLSLQQELLGSIEREKNRQRLLLEMAGNCATASLSDIDQAIRTSLIRLATEFKTDTVSVWLFSDDSSSMSAAYKWRREEQEGGYPLKTIPLAAVPWISNKIRAGEVIAFASLDDFPPDAENDRRELLRGKIQSFAAAPLLFVGETLGLLTIGSFRKRTEGWEDPELQFFTQAANVLGSAIGRKREEEQNFERMRMLAGDARDAEAKFHNVIESLIEGIVIADLEGFIRYANNRFTQITGFEKGEIVGKRIFDIFFPEELRRQNPEVERQYQNYARREWGRGVTEQLEARIFRRDGEERRLQIRVAPLRDKLGKVIGSVAVNADVTEQRMLEEQLRWSQKMEAVGRLAGGVAHDFNNLLTVISGYAGILLRGMNPKDRQYRRVEAIREASEAASSLTQQLLTVSRRQVVQPKILDLNEVVAYTTGIIQGLIGEGIKLRTKLSSGLPPITIDPGQIQQVIMNLAVNAKDAMPEGGTLKIRTDEHVVTEEERRLPIPLEPGVYAVLTVSDTGSGMDESVKSHLFEPFFTTKKAAPVSVFQLSTASSNKQEVE